MTAKQYTPSEYGDSEVELQRLFRIHNDDAKQYFLSVIKPRLDRSYKLYIAFGGDRAKEIKKWQSNIFVPYIQAVVETLMPRILDARPEFSVVGRNEESHVKAEKQRQLGDYLWELNRMDRATEDLVRSTLIYGTGFMQVGWKRDVRKLKFLDTKDAASKAPKWVTREKVFFDAPTCEWVDNYGLWYDWHNSDRKLKQHWFKRLVLSESEIKRRYPSADKARLAMALEGSPGDLTDYASIRQSTKTVHLGTVKGADVAYAGSTDKYSSTTGMEDLKMFEVFEWTRPFDDQYSVHVGGQNVPILKNGSMPIPFDFKEAPFIETTYLRVPGEFEGFGLPTILENPQLMLNLIKNQRLDSTTLGIHKMWIVNPLANITKEELVTRPFGIIYSVDPNGVREVQFSDIKQSAYQEEDLLKQDMRYTSGVDDFSMGGGGGAGSATEVRHLRESTLERVRMFVNHLGDSYADVMRYWMDMQRQFFTKDITIRITGDNGKDSFPLIQKDDLLGMFDYKATVLPSIAGQQDVKKKQDMDLFQLLITLPFIDQQKLTSKVIQSWDWSLDSVLKSEEDMQPAMPEEGAPMGPGMPAEAMAAAGPMEQAPQALPSGGVIPQDVVRAIMAMSPQNPFAEASSPINLLQGGAVPPTVRDATKAQPNTRGHNRTGKVNTNLSMDKKTDTESHILSQAGNIQR